MQNTMMRQVNERIHRDASSRKGSRIYMCECGAVACLAAIHMTAEQFEALLAEPECYVVAPGHADLDFETVGRGDGYRIIQRVRDAY